MNIDDKAPERLGVNENGEEVLLSNYRGKKVLPRTASLSTSTNCPSL